MEITPPRRSESVEPIEDEDRRDPTLKARRFLGRDWRQEEEEDPTVRRRIPRDPFPQSVEDFDEEKLPGAEIALGKMSLREQLLQMICVEGEDLQPWIDLGVGCVVSPDPIVGGPLTLTRWAWLEPAPPTLQALNRVDRHLREAVGVEVGLSLRHQGFAGILLAPDPPLMVGIQKGGGLVLSLFAEPPLGQFQTVARIEPEEMALHRAGVSFQLDQRLFVWLEAGMGEGIVDQLLETIPKDIIRQRALRVLRAKERLALPKPWTPRELHHLRHTVYRKNLEILRPEPTPTGPEIAILQLGSRDLDPLARALARRCKKVRRFRLTPDSLMDTGAERRLSERLSSSQLIVIAARGQLPDIPYFDQLCNRLRAHGKTLVSAYFEGLPPPLKGMALLSQEATTEAQVAIARTLIQTKTTSGENR